VLRRPVLQGTVFRSKVARRVFALFVFAAMVPILAIATLTLLQQRTDNARTITQQLHRETKAAALTFSYALDAIEAELRHLAQVPPESRASIFRVIPGDGLSFYQLLDEPAISVDDLKALEQVTPKVRRHLDSGKAALVVAGHSATAKLYMAMPFPERAIEEGLLLTTVHTSAMESINYDDDSVLCILTENGTPIHCSGRAPEEALRAAKPQDSSATFHEIAWQAGDQAWRGGFWRLYTAPRFLLPSLSVFWATTDASLVTRPSSFVEVFPPVIVLTMLVIVLVSISLIRRFLTPVDRLKEAANELAQGRFDSRVALASGDEFEDLGNSFNGMARDLEHQFTMLGTLAELDRMVLSAQGKKEIIDVLLERMPEISDCDAISVLEIADTKISNIRSRCLDPIMWTLPSDFGATLHVADLQVLRHGGNYLSIDDTEAHDVARPFFAIGMNRVVCLPVTRQGELSGIICLAYGRAEAATETAISRARSLADRAAVALSNAEWEEKLYHQAHYDALTGLPNRQLFIGRIEEALAQAQRQGTLVAVLFIDVDRFKSLNDSLGHHAGDQYLVQAAHSMHACIGEDCTLVRLGGDEFTVIVPNLPTPQAALEVTQGIAERLRKCLASLVVVKGQRIALSASIGIAIYPTDATGRIGLIRCADQAMYHSKERGRNTWSYYSEEINATAVERLELAAELEGALARGELQIYLQPQLNCRNDALSGAEVLLRWMHPRLGMVPPSKFIPVAEQMGLIVPIGVWVLEQACLQLKRWESRGLETLTLSVNISPMQLRRPDHVDLLCRTIEIYSAYANMLELEVTESTCVDNLQAATEIFRRLKESGVSIAIDDFGTGYSAMSYLRHFSIDIIKIDQAFVRGLPEDDFNKSFVAAIVTMAHSLGCTVVAEGVETEAQLNYLRGMGCEKAQGYYIAKPMSVENFDCFARSWQQSRKEPLRVVSS
jgi:diguanylate cyclase (GGDEF)-like protein